MSDYVVSAGIGGDNWATYRRKSNGSLKRVVSKALPVRATREEAEHDLLLWLCDRMYNRTGQMAREARVNYDHLIDVQVDRIGQPRQEGAKR